MQFALEKINDTVYMIDPYVFGQKGYISLYFVASDAPLLFDPGPDSAVETVFSAIESIGFKPEDLRYVFVSQVYPDHASGLKRILDRARNACALVSSTGTRHLIDPSKMQQTYQAYLGDFAKLLGDFPPVPSERIKSAPTEFELAGQPVKVVSCQGRAHHQLCLKMGELLFGADVLSTHISLDEHYLPASFPQGFDLQKYLQDLDTLLALNFSKLCISHYGHYDSPTDVITRSIDSVKWLRSQVDLLLKDGLSAEEASDTILSTKTLKTTLDADFVRKYAKANLLSFIVSVQKIQVRK
ncbi:hypothetical protein B9Q01_10070 [Candidatus Marsarchaeota G1 archaeon OSP_D]|uniref:Metallo-beta-lactamase domain-containing protein n=4 Tax=Candidatus Marsarchaeota TaxID=1978152 RepID=A0A2R6C2G1_9ARCH|nr:MAG: hypothetical protein B9Q01_10070 [Candidatus Marsarchaeota G1 archaeon OSP_D]PSN85542.1 MAG: hypothetical protein B9Q02_05975 [Candidatus Marsarchaeota G1 archaeon BE_D]PSN85690.1 MAG: hypothetical protein B9Q00_10835 [Candidatus Marsarchaeota G1 archaeon OSP_C]PSO05033.1 MAG: hypothetical protein B9Q12_01380 [Candidatus Marsarchaeota G2 archaeon ECH_B_SAG-G06]